MTKFKTGFSDAAIYKNIRLLVKERNETHRVRNC